MLKYCTFCHDLNYILFNKKISYLDQFVIILSNNGVYITAAFSICCRNIDFYLCIKLFRQIANDKLNIAKLQAHFKDQSIFGNGDIVQFYRKFEPIVKQTTVNWRVYNLVQTGVLSRIGRGIFTLGEGRNFVPQISSHLKMIYTRLHKQFPYLQICVWYTSIINELMLHQPGRFYTLVEVEKDAIENVFYTLKENKNNVFLNPSADILSRYASGEKEITIVKSLVSEAPMQKVNGVQTITIEKMLVDIFCDEIIFASQQGGEMENIFREAFSRYIIHESRMLRYADRRRKKAGFDNYLNKVSKFRQQTK